MALPEKEAELLRFAAAPGDGRGARIFNLPGRVWMIPILGLALSLFFLAVVGAPPLKAMMPFFGSCWFSWFFFYQRPPRFLVDWATTRISGRHAELRPLRRRAAMRALHPLRAVGTPRPGHDSTIRS